MSTGDPAPFGRLARRFLGADLLAAAAPVATVDSLDVLDPAGVSP
jgi:hypothetical protein